ncbi:MAG: nuclear transport factor 2 family protein [Gammaproteobacteria bacterium]|nr:nuclear transport factor 2 family protein [Gammaproteobacteria bacterium]
MKKLLSICLVLFAFFQCNTGWADVAADHDALRNLRKEAMEALNSNNFDHLTPLLDKSFTITTVDNHKFTKPEEFKAYWQSLLTGDKAVLKSIEFDPTADGLTEFLSPDIGVVYGTSTDTYHFTDGDIRKMHTRWTAVVRRNPDGWKLVAVHFSANIFHNPVLHAAKKCSYWFGAAGLILGFVIALLLMWCCRCRRTTA